MIRHTKSVQRPRRGDFTQAPVHAVAPVDTHLTLSQTPKNHGVTTMISSAPSEVLPSMGNAVWSREKVDRTEMFNISLSTVLRVQIRFLCFGFGSLFGRGEE